MTTPAALARASDPAPSSIERGATARLHWRHALHEDDALAAVATDGTLSAEWSAVLAETHARLLDPAGVRPLASPSPVGAAVGRACEADPSWPGLAAAAALHPSVAHKTTAALAPLVRGAVTRAGVARLDTRRTLADLREAREALEKARAAGDLRAAVEAGHAVEKASSAHQQACTGADALEDELTRAVGGDFLAHLAEGAAETAEGLRNAMGCGLGAALGAGSASEIPNDVVDMLSRVEVRDLLKRVGALHAALREGRDTRHLPGREGMLGPDVGGLDRVADARPLTRVALSGGLGDAMRALTTLQIVQGRAAVVQKGGAKANEGEIGIALDQSASMDGARALWAGAVTVAILLEARLQNRRAVLATFDGGIRDLIVVDGPTSMRAALVAVCRESDGKDTRVDVALAAMLKALRGLPQGGRRADALLITDGVWGAAQASAWPVGSDAPALRAVCIGGAIPSGVRLAGAWSLEPGDDDTVALVVAKSMV
jgi:hypothetical protein